MRLRPSLPVDRGEGLDTELTGAARRFVVLMHRLPRAVAADPRRALRAVGLIGATLVLLAYLPQLMVGEWGLLWRNVWTHGYVLGWLLVVSFLPRTVGPAQVAAYALMGFFLSMLLTFAIAEPLEGVLSTGNLQTAFVVPVVEEVAKTVPLALYALLVHLRRLPEPRIMDLVLLGFAVGAGFAVHEDGLWVRAVPSGFEGGGLWAWLFPTMLRGTQFVGAHALWTTLVGLGVGVFVVHRHRLRVWVVPVAALALATVDHAAINFRGGLDVRAALADGRMLPALLVLGILAAVAHDHLRWWRAEQADVHAPRPQLAWVAGGQGALAVLGRVRAALAYHRQRQAAHATLQRRRARGRPPPRLPVAAQLGALRGQLEPQTS